MKHRFSPLTFRFSHLTLTAAAVTLFLTACSDTDKAPRLDNRTDTLSWAMGENVGRTLIEGQVVDLDYDIFIKAVRHTIDGKKQPLSDEEYTQAIQYIMSVAQLKQMQETKQNRQGATDAQEEYFRQLVANNPNIKKHETGFYYEVLKEGKGRKAKYGDNVSFDYRSFLMLTGEPYDQTYDVREPIAHVIGKPMFQGLIDGMQLMNEGSIYRFYFPYQLAFGEKGADGIPGFTPFIYEVELHNFI